MAVAIRFARIGKKKAPFFRIVAINSRNSRDGEFLDNLGTYNPLTGDIVQLKEEKVQEWISKGAVPSDAFIKVHKKYKKAQSIPTVATAKSAAKKSKEKVAPALK